MTPVRIHDAEVIYRAGGTLFGIYETEAAGKAARKAAHTLGTFSGVDDIEAVVAALRPPRGSRPTSGRGDPDGRASVRPRR